MEDNSSTANPNPSQPIAMSPSKSVQTEANPEPHAPFREFSDPPPEKSDQESQEEIPKEGEEEEEEEEEGECGFCLFMKGGGCRDPFTEWEKCVEEGEKNKEDIVEKCFEVTSALKKCMEAHSDYYAPILQAEKAAEAEALKELEMEKEKGDESNSESGSTVTAEKAAEAEAEAPEELEMEKEKVDESNSESGSTATVGDSESSEKKES
ncbi:cilia- and flagella-associated protein 251-like [Ipomoea triloba]|uniref:cilia- and flagella-associated protein 251-like n=1 Tax=Ipomoea triloba TaxID=35885 RepID=UPI00125E6166|nr:cilia- and flagella-associated protein 251-like [Ipomoea triloba]